MITADELKVIAYELIAEHGEQTQSGPDTNYKKGGTQALALYQDIIVSTALNDVLRVEELLTKAQNVYGI
jgi:hypothetical protein